MAKEKEGKEFGNWGGFCKQGARVLSKGNIPTGHFKLDFAIQYGMDSTRVDLNKIDGYDPSKTLGIPLGKLVEIFGEEGSGKSSLAYRIAGFAQKKGHLVAWIDCEHSFQENLAKINGCDSDSLLYSNLVNLESPDKDYHAEDVIDAMIWMMEKQKVKVIVLDSIANLVPKALYEADSEQQFMALLPRLLSTNLGKLVSYAEKNGTLLVFINQLREKLNVRYGNPETSPGGHSLKHNASLRLKISKKSGADADIYVPDPETGDPILIGRHANVKLVKNRFAKPFTENLEIPIYYEPYFPEIEDIAFEAGRQIKLISVREGIYNWNGVKIKGIKNFVDHIKNNNLVDDLIKEIKIAASEKGVILPPEINLYKTTKGGDIDGKTTGEIPGDGTGEDSSGGKDNDKKSRRKKGS